MYYKGSIQPFSLREKLILHALDLVQLNQYEV